MRIVIPHPLLCSRQILRLLAVAGFGILCLLGCGVPGAPQPPSTGIPKFVGDLKAVRKGNTVTLTWTMPTETSDGELIRKAGKMLVQRALSTGHDAELNFQVISELPLEPTLKEDRGDEATAKDSLTSLLSTTGAEYALYQVLAQSQSGKSFGLPNRVSVPLVLTLQPPQKVQVKAIAAGIRISWEQNVPAKRESRITTQYVWRVMRKQEGANDAVMVRQLPASNEQLVVLDSAIEWEKNYQYWVVPVTLWQDGNRKGEIEGDDSPVATILAHDSFPPAAPSGMQAVYTAVTGQPSFIDITWTPNAEPDLAGYNVYRHVENEPAVKINTELVKTPRFADPGIQPGMKYFYSVSAVDLRGNESGRSEETTEAVPKE